MAAQQTTNQREKPGNKNQVTRSEPRRSETEEESSGYKIGEMAEQASNYVSERASEACEFAREHSAATVVAALATGLGIGLVVGRALGMSHRQPQRLRDRIAAEGLGRRLLDRIEGMIPDALAEHFRK